MYTNRSRSASGARYPANQEIGRYQSIFCNYSINERRKVKYLIMDMSQQFRDIILSCFPKAQIITDKIHGKHKLRGSKG